MSGEPQIVLHEDHFPVLYVQYIGPITDENWQGLIHALGKRMDGQEKFGWINDARTSHVPNAKQRAQLMDFYKSRADLHLKVAGVATVSTSGLVRGVVTALMWLSPVPFPHEMVPTVLEAENFVRRNLDPSTPDLRVASYPRGIATRKTLE